MNVNFVKYLWWKIEELWFINIFFISITFDRKSIIYGKFLKSWSHNFIMLVGDQLSFCPKKITEFYYGKVNQ